MFAFNQESGQLNSEFSACHDPAIVKAALTYIYVGKFDKDVLRRGARKLVDIAHEWRVQSLEEAAIEVLATNLQDCNNADTIKLAHRIKNSQLKQACFTFRYKKASQARPKALSFSC